MKLFLSYAVRDTELVQSLQADLEGFGHEVWRDVKIVGGQDWWDRICEEMRGCDAVVFAISPSSVRSRYCEAELQYALALSRPFLPIMIVDTTLATAPVQVQTTNVVPYHKGGRESIIGLAGALTHVPSGTPLPTDLPVQPEAPMGDVPGLRNRIVVPDQLSEQEQLDVVQALRRLCDGGEDVAIDLVRLMRGRHSLFESVARDLDELLDGADEAGVLGSEGRTLIKSLSTQADRRVLTPILGVALTDSLVGSRRSMARSFAAEFEFPLAEHLRDDLPQVAQFVRVEAGSVTLRERLRSHMDKQLREALGASVTDEALGLDDLFAEAWDARDRTVPDPHEMLVGMGCAIYVTAHPAQVLEHALRAAGRQPVTDVCRWKLDDTDEDWPSSPFDTTDGMPFRPSVDQPLVFHVFGVLTSPDTLVVTEDDYFKFLIGVTSQRDTKVPAVVRSALADSALLVLGFRLDDWDFRALWQALMSQEGNRRLRNYKHIAAQVDPAGSVASPGATRHYLSEYFGRDSTPSLDLFWGSVDDFTAAVFAERGKPG
jgi:hypothetical protein